MNFSNIIIEIRNGTAIITINRPDKLNALNHQTLVDIKNAFEEINHNDGISSVIITGAGEKSFVAGADITELNKLNMLEGKKFSEFGQSVFNIIENCDKPVVAAVNGFALGGGCELALACHFRVASENAKFGQPEVNLGIIPGYGGTQRLTRLVGKGMALEMILTGDMIDANEALRIGLVNKVFPSAELINKTLEITQKINSKGQHAIHLAIEAIKATDQMNLREGLDFEAVLFGVCCGTEDFKEGTSAFLQKRKPVFKNK